MKSAKMKKLFHGWIVHETSPSFYTDGSDQYENGWIVTGRTRLDAIETHVRAWKAQGSIRDDLDWAMCRSMGHRCVRVELFIRPVGAKALRSWGTSARNSRLFRREKKKTDQDNYREQMARSAAIAGKP